jgi:hypothetical protein
MRRALAAALVLSACSGTVRQSSVAPTEIDVPAAQPGHSDGSGALPAPARSEPLPPPPRDPLEDYVGSWDGMVNGGVSTELVVEPTGRFRVRASATVWRAACDLTGRFRAGEDVVWMDVETSSCTVVTSGSSLERRVLSKSAGEFSVQSPDGSLVIHYTRRRP